MLTHYWIGDYVGVHFDEASNEIGIGVGAPILSHEISKIPNQQPKWTGYDQQEVHHIHLRSIGKNGLVIGFSFRVEQWADIPFKTKTLEVNCDGQVTCPLHVTADHKIVAKQPLISGADCSSSGIGIVALLDHMGSALTFIISGGKDQFGLLDMLAGIGAAVYDFGAILSDDPLFVSDPVQRAILSERILGYTQMIWDIDDQENEVFLDDIRFEPKGIWLIFKYPQWLEDAIDWILGRMSVL